MENNDDDDNNRASNIGVAMEEKLTGSDINANAKVNAASDGHESSKSREEGELSSDDDDYQGAASVSQIADHDAAQVESVQAAPVNKITEDIKAEKCFPGIKSTSMVDISSGPYPQLDQCKGSEKNRVPFVPFLISFSDDDTASDSDDSRHKIVASREKTQGTDRSRRPPLPYVQKSQKFPQNTMNEARVKPKGVYLNRPSFSSVFKINRANSRNSRHIMGFRNLNDLQKAPVGQNSERKTNVQLNTDKLQLQDLRQLIAIRESQLKLKSAQKTNNSSACLFKDNNIRNLRNPANRLRGADSVDDLRIGTKEPDKKRLKAAIHQSSQLGLDCLTNIHYVEGNLASGKSELENYGKQRVDDSSHLGKKDCITTSHSSYAGWQKQNLGQSFVSSATPLVADKGANVVADSSVGDKNDEIAGPVVLLNQTGQIEKRAGGDFPRIAAPRNNPGFSNCLDKDNMMEGSNMDMQSLLNFEELQDKELEEAQEHRHRCETEERNALKAYRKAQRALMEANARCSYLYSKRDLYSVQIRSLMMDNTNLFFSSRPHDQIEAGLNFTNNISDVDAHLKPTSSHHVQAAFDIRKASDSNVPSANNAFQNLSDLHVDGQNLVSDPDGEPDGSSSEASKQDNVSHGVSCPSDDLSRSADADDETFQFEHRSSQDNLESQKAPEFNGGIESFTKDGSEKQLSFDSSQDSLLLEASLRSQLFEKLKAKKLFKRGTSQSVELAGQGRVENDGRGKMLGNIAETASHYEAANEKISDLEGINKEERSSELAVQINNQLDIYRSEHTSPSAADPIDSYCSLESQQSTISSTFLCATMKSAFIHLKVAEPVSELKLLNSSTGEENADLNIHAKSQAIRSSLDANEMNAFSLCVVGQTGYYSCNLAIDPFWPLCMYELRGKCNNNECHWQHVKDYSCEIVKRDTIGVTGYQVENQSQREEFHSTAMLSKCFDYLWLNPPTYVVGSDVLKPDSQSYTSMLVQGYGKCWQKSFSTFLVLSSVFPSVLRLNEPFLHGTEARIEVHNGWNRQSSYFQSKNGTENEVDLCFVDVDQSLDMALLNFNQEVNKHKGRIEALKVLVQAIEADPKSVVLWIVYLQMYYCNQKSIGKDDLFQYAVEFNKESYELWLLYINSRVRLDDRLAAYDAALSTLSHQASTSDGDVWCVSQCVLDIFLQMMDFLCMCGYPNSAIEKISGHFLPTKRSDEPCSPSLPDVITCLHICDKFIFWVCCVYLVVYKKLPDTVVHRFECWKESSAIEWPDTHLTFDEKQQAALLMEMAVDSLASYMDSESLENEKTLRAAHLFALNHVRCVSVLEGLECSKNLLEKYIELYPSCLELILMAARAEYHMGGLSFHGFEEALRNWPDEVPGIQCIWNQYVECLLQSGKFDLVKELTDRWFHCAREPNNSCLGVLQTKDVDSSSASLQSASVPDLYALFSGYSQKDIMFGMLNFSLYKRLQNDQTEARLALEQALKAASADTYHHCLRELTMFLLTESIQYNGDARLKHILKILNVHLIDAHSLLAIRPLSTGFIQNIKKPRVRQLVSKLVRPVSADFSLMNMVLEVWNSLVLVPQIYNKLTDLVDFVEAMMEILPSNYLLAISVYKVLSRNSNPGNVSPSFSFWASSLLVNALFHAVPVAPEYAWVEAANVLYNLTSIQKISESFHKKALSVYPFSIRLWKSYLQLSEKDGCGNSVKEAAKEKGIELD